MSQGKFFRAVNVAAIRKYRVAPAFTSNLFNANGASRLFRFLTNPRETTHLGLLVKISLLVKMYSDLKHIKHSWSFPEAFSGHA